MAAVPCPSCGQESLRIMVDVTLEPILTRNRAGRLVCGRVPADTIAHARQFVRGHVIRTDEFSPEKDDVVCTSCGAMFTADQLA